MEHLNDFHHSCPYVYQYLQIFSNNSTCNMPYKNCPICFQAIFVKSNRHTIFAHIEEAHPENLKVMKANGGFASKTQIQHQVEGMCRAPSDVCASSSSRLPPVELDTQLIDHLADRLGTVNLHIPQPRDIQKLMTAQPASRDSIMCAICGLHFPDDVSNREIGFHYRACFRGASATWSS